jgi:hypothetical protein
MADSKITALGNLTAADPVNDMFPIVDVNDFTMAASGTTKRISVNNLLSSSPTASGALTVTGLVTAGSATITGAATVGTTLGVTGALTCQSTASFFTGTALPLHIRNSGTSFTQIGDNATIGAGTAFVVGSSDSSLRFQCGGAEQMRLNSTGLGVGVTPSVKLDVLSASAEGTIRLTSTIDGSTASPKGSSLSFRSGSSSTETARIASFNRFSNVNGGDLVFSTADSSQVLQTRATIDSSGNLHVGTTAYVGVAANFVNSLNGFNIVPDNTANAANRNWNLAANGGAAGNLDFVISSANNTFPNSAYRMQLTSAGALNNTTGTYGTISDLRLKENISDARNYLADLLKLRVVKYSLKEESSAVATKLGFIAQEVELVFPNLVDQSDKEYDGAEGIRSVKTSILIPMLLKAMQELTARVQTLEAR